MTNRANGSYALEAVDVTKTSGDNMSVGDIDVTGGAAMWLTNTTSGEQGTIRIKGPIVGDCATGVSFDVQSLVYWNAGSSLFTATATDTPAGFALAAKAAGPGLNQVEVYLNPFES